VKRLEIIVLTETSFDLYPPTSQQFLEYFATFSLASCVSDAQQTVRLKYVPKAGLLLSLLYFVLYFPS